MISRLLVILLLFCSGFSVAAEEIKTKTSPEVMSAGSMVQVLGGLLLVVALIFVISWLMRRVSGITVGHGGKLKVLAGIPLGPRDRLVLVKVGDKQILLGASPGRINTLHVFDEPVIEDSDEPASDFAQKLQEIVKRGGAS
ncbi:flagellar biosynthetic protein FliO [Aestuariirhabdus sp. Z084]|uniref:flagellar biosynthetic protein FliO n=1 Tax=Aestuariirhabdus haliotis TaxID=2918751 RepID=UPI00201B3767|nr:flagellar biosynthetic protein FliO [Aestuariirhabdus haliotis]MCL6414470.1 flagellar biosynthetic protein FliO [Aestuariirhabdus haliotis]MCL6418548.1 flagellar biosynthetic protein FliO [Aestuariirhabdus haliotis]